MFGNFIKERRLKKRLSLRQFCEKIEADPSQWSKIERGILPPPKSDLVLDEIAKVLALRQNSEDWLELRDLAAIGGGRLPSDLLSDEDLVQYLPLVFRTVRNSKPTEEELHNLAEIIRNNIQQ